MVKANFKAQQPEVDFKFTVSSVRRSAAFILTEYAKKGEKTQEADADQSPIVTKQEENV
ncbi:MAG: hypothetical protein LIP05_10235 [Tannerellaceae bacterium]|nr:hypothetical protein [Tannerellaceae bacterium]